MTAKELLIAQIDGLDEQSTDAVLQFVRQLSESKPAPRKGSLLDKLKSVRIKAPADFAVNLDFYLSGEKCVDDVH